MGADGPWRGRGVAVMLRGMSHYRAGFLIAFLGLSSSPSAAMDECREEEIAEDQVVSVRGEYLMVRVQRIYADRGEARGEVVMGWPCGRGYKHCLGEQLFFDLAKLAPRVACYQGYKAGDQLLMRTRYYFDGMFPTAEKVEVTAVFADGRFQTDSGRYFNFHDFTGRNPEERLSPRGPGRFSDGELVYSKTSRKVFVVKESYTDAYHIDAINGPYRMYLPEGVRAESDLEKLVDGFGGIGQGQEVWTPAGDIDLGRAEHITESGLVVIFKGGKQVAVRPAASVVTRAPRAERRALQSAVGMALQFAHERRF